MATCHEYSLQQAIEKMVATQMPLEDRTVSVFRLCVARVAQIPEIYEELCHRLPVLDLPTDLDVWILDNIKGAVREATAEDPDLVGRIRTMTIVTAEEAMARFFPDVPLPAGTMAQLVTGFEQTSASIN